MESLPEMVCLLSFLFLEETTEGYFLKVYNHGHFIPLSCGGDGEFHHYWRVRPSHRYAPLYLTR